MTNRPVTKAPQPNGAARVWSSIRGRAGAHRSITILIGWAIVGALMPLIVLVPPLSTFQAQKLWVDGFAFSGVFILLAMGLNIVVGLAGLLDLGYAAFFAIGSYAYALGASPFSGIHIPFWPMLLVGAFVAATFGTLLGLGRPFPCPADGIVRRVHRCAPESESSSSAHTR